MLSWRVTNVGNSLVDLTRRISSHYFGNFCDLYSDYAFGKALPFDKESK